MIYVLMELSEIIFWKVMIRVELQFYTTKINRISRLRLEQPSHFYHQLFAKYPAQLIGPLNLKSVHHQNVSDFRDPYFWHQNVSIPCWLQAFFAEIFLRGPQNGNISSYSMRIAVAPASRINGKSSFKYESLGGAPFKSKCTTRWCGMYRDPSALITAGVESSITGIKKR